MKELIELNGRIVKEFGDAVADRISTIARARVEIDGKVISFNALDSGCDTGNGKVGVDFVKHRLGIIDTAREEIQIFFMLSPNGYALAGKVMKAIEEKIALLKTVDTRSCL